jgi:hypothetical protein
MMYLKENLKLLRLMFVAVYLVAAPADHVAIVRADLGSSPMVDSEVRSDEQDDVELIQAVQTALEHSSNPDQMERLVGRKPTIDTVNALHKAAMRIGSIVPDETKNRTIPHFAKMIRVIYWIRPKPAHLIGICWDSTGKASLVYGIVLPP